MGLVLDWNVIIAFAAGLLILFLLLKVLSTPFRIIWKFFLNVLTGAVCLLVFNFFGDFFGFTIAVNIITAFVVGFFGLPGVVLLVALKFILKI